MAQETEDAITKAMCLPDGWDSYDGVATTTEAATAALRFLKVIDTPPAVVPCSDGGIQLEWHTGGLDIEVAFGTDGTIEFWAAEKAKEA
jgi:hypothetical protein